MKVRALGLATLWVAAACTGALGDPAFEGLGFLDVGHPHSEALAVSDDGLWVIGQSYNATGQAEAFRWTPGDVMRGLGSLNKSGIGDARSWAYGASGDGSVIVGLSHTGIGTSYEAFRWTEAGGMASIGDLPNGSVGGAAHDISADGATIVGHGHRFDAAQPQAVKWQPGLSMLAPELPLDPNSVGSQAQSVSSDGLVAVGFSDSSLGHEACYWDNLGIHGLGSVGTANNASADGSVIVGVLTPTSSDSQAFRWTSGPPQGLGYLDGDTWSEANDVSSEGSIVVGSSGKTHAFIWDSTNGMRSLSAVLLDLGLRPSALDGWELQYAMGVSADGNVIVGYGTHTVDNVPRTEAFAATLNTVPEPFSIAFMGTAFSVLVAGRLRKRCRRSQSCRP